MVTKDSHETLLVEDDPAHAICGSGRITIETAEVTIGEAFVQRNPLISKFSLRVCARS